MTRYFFTILLFCLAALSQCARSSLELEITADQLQKSLHKYFPLFLPGLDYITVLETPQVVLLRDKVQVATRLVIPAAQAGQALAEVTLTTSLAYEGDNQTVYLTRLQLEEFASAILDDTQKQETKAVINQLLTTRLSAIPVFTLDQKDFKEQLAAYLLQDVSVADDKIMLSLDRAKR